MTEGHFTFHCSLFTVYFILFSSHFSLLTHPRLIAFYILLFLLISSQDKTGMKRIKDKNEFYTVPMFEEIPHLFHGFAAVDWGEKDLEEKLKLNEGRLLFLRQIHSNIIHILDKFPEGKLEGDAFVTSLPHLALAIRTADCLPVLITDQSAKVIGAVHCGWKGTKKRIIQEAVFSIKKHYNLEPSSLLIALGPCIGPECYEIGENVRQEFVDAGLSSSVFKHHPYEKGKYFLDLKEANLLQLLEAGVKKNNISNLDFCTHCSSSLPSWRRSQEKTSRMVSFIGKTY